MNTGITINTFPGDYTHLILDCTVTSFPLRDACCDHVGHFSSSWQVTESLVDNTIHHVRWRYLRRLQIAVHLWCLRLIKSVARRRRRFSPNCHWCVLILGDDFPLWAIIKLSHMKTCKLLRICDGEFRSAFNELRQLNAERDHLWCTSGIFDLCYRLAYSEAAHETNQTAA